MACAVCKLDEKTRTDIATRKAAGEGPTAIANDLGRSVSPRQIRYHLDSCEASDQAARVQALGKVADLLTQSGIDPAEIGKVEKVRLNTYQSITKDDEGEAHVHDLEAASVVLTPAWAEGPRWDPISQAAPTTIEPADSEPNTGEWKTCVVLPDPQIGYRRNLKDLGELDPFQDETAIACALKLVRHLNPDLVVNLGDFLDLADFSRFTQEPGFVQTVQPSLDRAHRFLAEQRANAPNAHIALLEGNHDRRLENAIIKNLKAAFGIRRAGREDELPVMSIPYLLRLEELGVEYVGGYPAGEFWINDRLRAIHGIKVRSAGSTAKSVVDDERVSNIFGHVHRIERQHKTTHTRRGPKFTLAATPGCLSRLDGTVPSMKGSTDIFGRPITSWENWQHGIAVVTYREGDAPFNVELVPIHEGVAIFRGQEFAA